MKTMKITEEAHEALVKIGNKDETFSDIILKLAAFWQLAGQQQKGDVNEMDKKKKRISKPGRIP